MFWSDSGDLVTLACEDTFYVLRYSRESFLEAVQTGQIDEDGAEAAFETITDINESVRTGQWIGDCFVYTTSTNRLNYLVGDQTYTISHFDSPHYVLGYLQRDQRIYLADRDVAVTSFALSVSVIEFQTLVLRGDLDSALSMLPDIDADQKNKIARFLEGQGYKEQALDIATDAEHRFDLALQLNQLEIALDLARQADAEHKWKTVGDAALNAWDMKLATECFSKARDLGSLLLVHSSTGSAEGLRDLASQAEAIGAHNISFSCLWQLADLDGCVNTLLKTGRTAEAALFALTYSPSRAPRVAAKWRRELDSKGKGKVAKILGMPPGVENEKPVTDGDDIDGEPSQAKAPETFEPDEELFPDFAQWLKMEQEGRSAQESLIDVDGAANGMNGASAAPEAVEASKGLKEIEKQAEAEAEVAQ